MKEYPRKLRVNTQLRSELAQLVRGLSDPRVVGVTITEVDVSPDLRNARISVSLLGDDAQLAGAVSGLNHAAGKLRHDLGHVLRLRQVPSLRFVPDVGLRQSDRLNTLIREAVRQDAARSGDADPSGSDGGKR